MWYTIDSMGIMQPVETFDLPEEEKPHVMPKGSREPWIKGMKSPNPFGHPKGYKSLTALLKERFKQYPTEGHKIIETLVKMAMRGDLAAIREVLDRIDGKVTEVHKIEGDLPITLILSPAPLRAEDIPNVIEGQFKEVELIGTEDNSEDS